MRKLTAKQLFALDCVAKNRVVIRRVHNRFVRSWAGGSMVLQFWALDGPIDDQIKALRKRKLVRLQGVFTTAPTIEVTQAGLDELIGKEPEPYCWDNYGQRS